MTIARDLADVAVLMAPSGSNVVFDSTVGLTGGTANGLIYLDGSKVATTGSALMFDGTDMGVGGAVESGIKLKVFGAVKVQNAQPIFYMNSDNTNNVQIVNAGATGTSNGQMAFTLGGVGELMRLNSTSLNVATHVVPTTTGTRDLGTNLLRFKDLYLSGSNLYIGTKTANLSRTSPTIAPSLNLDFANSGVVDDRVTFNRSTRSTFYNQKGLLEVAGPDSPRIEYDPDTGECRGLLIEESRTNLHLYSDGFSGSQYLVEAGNYRNSATIAPDGSYSGSVILEGTSFYTRTTTAVSFNSGSTYTYSAYLKAGSRTQAQMQIYSATTNVDAVFDLISGTLISVNGGTATIISVGNGWYRCTVTGTTTASSGYVFTYPAVSNDYSYTHISGLESIYIWGSQLELGSFPTSYIPTTPTFTSRASSATYFDSVGTLKIAGVNQPRYSYSYDSISGKWVSTGLVLENAATNLVSHSTLNNNWIVNDTTLTSSQTAPDLSSAAYLFSSNGGTSSVGVFRAYILVQVSAGVRYSISCFAKFVSGNKNLRIKMGSSFGEQNATFNLITGAILNVGGLNTNAYIQNCGNGWYRCILSAVSEITVNASLQLQFTDGTFAENITTTTNDKFLLWGVQVEANSIATSYIPTYGTTATRAGDVSTSAQTTRVRDSAALIGANFTSWWKNTEQSYYAEALQFPLTDYGRLIDISDGSTQRYSMYRQSGIGTNGINNQIQITGDTWATNTFAKFAASFSSTGISSAFNGTLRTNVATFTPFTADRMNIGQQTDNSGVWNGYIKKIVYYPKRLSNSELQALTS